MSFIFRAYHAMARQRPMSTKTGLPTAAIYVFVNMLRKLRDDFSPQYLAAVFDVAGPTFRDEQAEAVTSIRKFDIKTQTFTEVEYKGYKANRAAMPEDLVQQVPYIRRALEAYRIPILEVVRFEADDVIGTLARKAAEASHPVYVVSSDKDMMQLVNDKVQILNPPKDNLICDAAKVEEILGVPPERVVDVMALRGDAIDNIPGAPGIGDKGSVEIIKRFGTVEQALERAAEVEKKTYRESLQNNRDDDSVQQEHGDHRHECSDRAGCGSHARGRAGRGRAARAVHRAGIYFAAERTAAGGRGERDALHRGEVGGGCRDACCSAVRAGRRARGCGRTAGISRRATQRRKKREDEPQDAQLSFMDGCRRDADATAARRQPVRASRFRLPRDRPRS